MYSIIDGIKGDRLFIAIEGFFLEDRMVLYWTEIPEATGYIVLLGNSTDYTYSMETPEPVLFVTEPDYIKASHVAVRAKKGSAVSDILMHKTIYSWGNVGEQVFDPAVFAEQKAAWEALNITSYRFTARSDTNPPQLSFTVTVLPDAEPQMEYDEKQAGWYYPGEMEGDTFKPFNPFAGKTIDDLFSSMDELLPPLADADPISAGYIICIRYNATYHFVEYVNSIRLTPGLVGGWGGFHVSSFEVLERE